jgi:hypothetical protein
MATDTARLFWLKLGAHAKAAVTLCVEDCRSAGDEVAARFWTEVADRLQAILRQEGILATGRLAESRPLAPASRTWRFMQRIEFYRHRAMHASRMAAKSEALRGELIDVATQWFDLAQHAEWLAEESDAGDATPEPKSKVALGGG